MPKRKTKKKPPPRDQRLAAWFGLEDQEKEWFEQQAFLLWALENPKLVDTGKTPDIYNRPWHKEIYIALQGPRDCVFMKATQVGITTAVLLWCMWGARHVWPKGFVYYMPHQKGMGDLVRTKVDPVIKSTFTLSQFAEKGVDNIGMKRIGKSFGYFRGIDSPQMRKSVPADVVAMDEYDDMVTEHVEEAMRRMEDSKVQKSVKLSVPSIPGFGIDAAFQDSTQNYWTLYCEACQEDWTVEDSWPDCHAGRVGTRYLACPNCKAPADIQKGRWVSKRPDAKAEGFAVNGVMNPNLQFEKALVKWETSTDPVVLTRNFLGKACMDESGERLVAQHVLTLCDRSRPMHTIHEGPTWMGVDTGKNRRTSRGVIFDWPEDKTTGEKGKPRIIKAFSWQDPDELDDAMDMFHVERCIIDAGGEPRLAEAFCKRWKGRAFACIYRTSNVNAKKSIRGRVIWSDAKRTIQVDRTEWLDKTNKALYTSAVELPQKNNEIQILAEECQRLVRITSESEGNKFATWKNEGADHYRHAINYGWIGMMAQRISLKPKTYNIGGIGNSNLPARFRRLSG